jgi:sulfate transport system permease protein
MDVSRKFIPRRALLIALAVAIVAILLVLPLAVVFAAAFSRGTQRMLDAISDPDAQSAIRLTLLVAAISVPVNTVCGVAAAWCIARFRFPGRVLLLTFIELPLAISPVISGLVWVLVFGLQGWFGATLQAHGVAIIFATPGLVLATLFVTFPLVCRQILPRLIEQGRVEEEAAMTLGASGWQMFRHVTLPGIAWTLLQGVLLCNARAMGEFGAVSVVSGHIRGETNTMPLHIEALYNDFQGAAAFTIAALLAGLALVTLAAQAALAWRTQRATTDTTTS